MKNHLLLFLLIVLFSFFSCEKQQEVSWPTETQTSKPWTRWWWMDCAVDSANISRELKELADAGIGGVEITPIYGVEGEVDRVIEFLSPEFSDILSYTIKEAEKLGMGVDLPPGSGWRCGGPFVPVEKGLWNLKIEKNDTSGFVTNAVQNRDKVKRPAKGGEGLAIDTYNKKITSWYLDEFWKRLNIPEEKIRCFFHDSFEYTGDFTLNFEEEFRKRRAYNLNEVLYLLADDTVDPELTARVKSDYRETLADLVLESFIQPMTTWANSHKSLNRNQAHGSPGNLLDLYESCDIPETEFFRYVPEGEPRLFIQKFASSAAHISGKKLSSSESFTWLDEHWTVTPTEMLRATNRFFLAGINHMFFHGTCYSPKDAEWPGWLFYASSQINNRNPLWRELPALFHYIGRIQSMLQEATPKNNVLVYWPYYDVAAADGRLFKHLAVGSQPEWFYMQPLAGLSKRLTHAGYGFDYISDKQIVASKPEEGLIVTSGDVKYDAIVVPVTNYITLETLKQLISFHKNGIKVYFDDRLPQSVPGYNNWKEREAELNALKNEIESSQTGDAVLLLDKGKITNENDLVQKGFYFLKMKDKSEDVILVFNLENKMLDEWVELNTTAKEYVFMNPMTGAITKAETKGGKLHLQLQPEESVFIKCCSTKSDTPLHHYFNPTAKRTTIEGRWHISFQDGGPVYPGDIDVVKLQSWTTIGDAETVRFAGTVRYSTELDWQGSSTAWIDLGKVLDCARLVVNDKNFGTLPGPVYTWEIDNLKPGKNQIVIEVTNVAANRIRDLDRRGVNWKKFKDINFVNIDYRPFDASGWPVRDAGLMGPVVLYSKQ
ncbi:MAG: glycosyl hydrolase [Draconibacterium sp.]